MLFQRDDRDMLLPLMNALDNTSALEDKKKKLKYFQLSVNHFREVNFCHEKRIFKIIPFGNLSGPYK